MIDPGTRAAVWSMSLICHTMHTVHCLVYYCTESDEQDKLLTVNSALVEAQ